MPDDLFKNVTAPTDEKKDDQKPASDAPVSDAEIKEGNSTAKDPISPTELKPEADTGSKLNLAPVPDDDDPSDEEFKKPDELAMLKQRANMMGISYSNNIGVEALREKVNAKINGESDKPEVKPEVDEAKAARMTEKTKKVNLRQYMRDTQMKLVRIRISNLDPKKKDLMGEVFTVANEYLGRVTKFVPYGELTDGGWHVPQCIYQQLIDRKFLSIKVVTKKGKEEVQQQWVREFSIDVLPPLTETELAQLANAQRAAGSVE